MNRDAKTQSALVAVARRRRKQRALAHAYLHHGAPIPTLRLSLGFLMATSTTSELASAAGHRMTVIGVAAAERVAYVVEELNTTEAPIVYRLWLSGPRAGNLVPIHAWYEQCDDPREIRARIAAIASTLEPIARTTTEAWMLSTRVVQRRALRTEHQTTPIRKYALQLRVEPVSGYGPTGHTTVTAFLRPHAELVEVWALADGTAIARVRYTGIPAGLGAAKETVILLTE